MSHRTNLKICFIFLSLMFFSQTFSLQMSSKQMLFNQIMIGEMMHRTDIIESALNKLQRFASNDPNFLVYKIRFLLMTKQHDKAKALLETLGKLAPQTAPHQQAKRLIYLHSPQGKQALLQAKILVLSGQYTKAINAFDALYEQDPPSLIMAMNYWSLIAKDPKRNVMALRKLEALFHKFQALGLMKHAEKNIQNWQYQLVTDIADAWVTIGKKALEKSQHTKARHAFNKAIAYQTTHYEAWVGLGDLSLALNHLEKAEYAYKKAHAINEDGNLAIHGLIGVYQRRSPKLAIKYIKSLPDFMQDKMLIRTLALKSSTLQERAEHYKKKGQFSLAVRTLKKALTLSPNDVWITYDLAVVYRQMGRQANGLNVLKKLKTTHENQASKYYSLAVYLYSIDKTQEALNALNRIPKNQWSTKIRRKATQLNLDLLFRKATAYYNQGAYQSAYNVLLRQQHHISVLVQLGDWLLAQGNAKKALYYYSKALKKEPNNEAVVIGIMEAYVELNQPYYVKQLLNKKPWETYLKTLNSRRRIAKIWRFLGHEKMAYQLLQKGKSQAIAAPKNTTTSMYLKALAEQEKEQNNINASQTLLKQTMVKSKITASYPNNNEYYTRHTRNQKEDDWLKRNLRIDAAELYQQQMNRFTLQHDFRQLAGVPGISDFKAHNTTLQYARPYAAGRIRIRADRVSLNAGEFKPTNAVFSDDFGTCTNGCNEGFSQQKSGYSAMVEWQSPQWLVNIGFTPFGFDVVNWIGDITYQSTFHDVGWALSAIHEPYTNSLLSYSGTKDPNSKLIWGGVVASGAELALNYDKGKAHGFWSNLDVSLITGKNVINNYRILLNSGYYYKLINENNRRLTLGLTNLLWHFDKNLNHYTLGHGGYFSPQFYTAFTVPINYQYRNDVWSLELGASASWSHSRTSDILQFPVPELVPDLNATPNSLFRGGRSSTLGYRLLASLERRLSSHFILGAMLDMQRSPDFTPNQGLIYLKYTLEPWQGDLDMPIRPINPYIYDR